MAVFFPRVPVPTQRPDNTASIAQSVADLFANLGQAQDDALRRDYMEEQMQTMRVNRENEALKFRMAEEAAGRTNETVALLSDLFNPMQTQPDPGTVGPPQPKVMGVDEKLRDPLNTARLNRAIIGMTVQDGMKGLDVAQILRTLGGTSNLSDEKMTGLFVGAGGKLGENDALSLGRQNQIRGENMANDLEKIRYRESFENQGGGGTGFSITLPDGQTISWGPQGGGAAGGAGGGMKGSPMNTQNLQNVQQLKAVQDLNTTIDGLKSSFLQFDAEGKPVDINRTALLKNDYNPFDKEITPVPITEGMDTSSRLMDAITKKAFATYGKAVSNRETERMVAIFAPSALDTPTSLNSKMERLRTMTADEFADYLGGKVTFEDGTTYMKGGGAPNNPLPTTDAPQAPQGDRYQLELLETDLSKIVMDTTLPIEERNAAQAQLENVQRQLNAAPPANPGMVGGVSPEDPRVQKVLQAGYTMEELQDALNQGYSLDDIVADISRGQ